MATMGNQEVAIYQNADINPMGTVFVITVHDTKPYLQNPTGGTTLLRSEFHAFVMGDFEPITKEYLIQRFNSNLRRNHPGPEYTEFEKTLFKEASDDIKYRALYALRMKCYKSWSNMEMGQMAIFPLFDLSKSSMKLDHLYFRLYDADFLESLMSNETSTMCHELRAELNRIRKIVER